METLPLRSSGNTSQCRMWSRSRPLCGARVISASQEPRLPTLVFTTVLPRIKLGPWQEQSEWQWKVLVGVGVSTDRLQKKLTFMASVSERHTLIFGCFILFFLTDKFQMNPLYIWLPIVILLLILIILIILYVRRRRNKQGEYHFVPGKATDGSDIPLSPTSNGVKT